MVSNDLLSLAILCNNACSKNGVSEPTLNDKDCNSPHQ